MFGWNAVMTAYAEFVNAELTMTFGFFVGYTITLLVSGGLVVAGVRLLRRIRVRFTKKVDSEEKVSEMRKGFRT